MTNREAALHDIKKWFAKMRKKTGKSDSEILRDQIRGPALTFDTLGDDIYEHDDPHNWGYDGDG